MTKIIWSLLTMFMFGTVLGVLAGEIRWGWQVALSLFAGVACVLIAGKLEDSK